MSAREQFVGVEGVRAVVRASDRGRDEDFAVVDRDRSTQCVEDALGSLCAFGARCVLADDRELVPAEPCDRVAVSDGRVQSLCHLDEDAVAGLVTECVVDDLEVVEIAEQDRDDLTRAAGLRERVLEPVPEQQPVCETGEAVVERLIGEFTRQLALRRCRALITIPRAPPRSFSKLVYVNSERQPASVGVTDPATRGDNPVRGAQDREHLRRDVGAVVRMNEVGRARAEQLAGSGRVSPPRMRSRTSRSPSHWSSAVDRWRATRATGIEPIHSDARTARRWPRDRAPPSFPRCRSRSRSGRADRPFLNRLATPHPRGLASPS